MATAFTRSIILVVRPAVADAVNQRLKDAAWDDAGGDKTFTVPLRAAGDAANAIVGYWAAGTAKPAMLVGLRDRLTAAGATAAETTLIPKSATRASVSAQRIFCFDGAVWTPDEVLAFLQVDRLAPAPL